PAARRDGPHGGEPPRPAAGAAALRDAPPRARDAPRRAGLDRAAAYDSAIGRLRHQKVGLAVGAVAGALATLAVVAVVVLAGGAHHKRHVTLRQGDVAVAPLAATRREASVEAGSPN